MFQANFALGTCAGVAWKQQLHVYKRPHLVGQKGWPAASRTRSDISAFLWFLHAGIEIQVESGHIKNPSSYVQHLEAQGIWTSPVVVSVLGCFRCLVSLHFLDCCQMPRFAPPSCVDTCQRLGWGNAGTIGKRRFGM